MSYTNRDPYVSTYCAQDDTCHKRSADGDSVHEQHVAALTSSDIYLAVTRTLRTIGCWNQDWGYPTNFNQWRAFSDRQLDQLPFQSCVSNQWNISKNPRSRVSTRKKNIRESLFSSLLTCSQHFFKFRTSDEYHLPSVLLLLGSRIPSRISNPS